MHIGIASVHWQRRKAVRSIRICMKFVQVSSNLIWMDSQLLVISQSPYITMQDTFPVEGSKPLLLVIFDSRTQSVNQVKYVQ